MLLVEQRSVPDWVFGAESVSVLYLKLEYGVEFTERLVITLAQHVYTQLFFEAVFHPICSCFFNETRYKIKSLQNTSRLAIANRRRFHTFRSHLGQDTLASCVTKWPL